MKKLLIPVLILFMYTGSDIEAQGSGNYPTRQLIYEAVISEDGTVLGSQLLGCALTNGSCLDEVEVEGEYEPPTLRT
jgi:hypothetical protein